MPTLVRRLRRSLGASAVSLAGIAAGLPVTIIAGATTSSAGRLVAQTPRLTPPPPCRAPGADTALVASVRASARRGFTSVAVLEFDSRVMDERRSHLAPAITAQLRSRLATIPAVAVESRGTVERVFASSGGRIDSLLSVLGDQFAVTGDVIPQRDRIDVTVRIMQSGKEAPRWERVFAYPRTPIHQIEESVGAAVAELAESRIPANPLRMSAAAYEIALRGDYFLAQHDALSADSARRTFERAMAADRESGIPAARAARARAEYLERVGRLDARMVGEQVLAGMTLVDAALRNDSANAEAWTARAMLLRYRNPGSYAGVVSAHERAVALAPNSADAHEEYGTTLVRLGRDAAAEQHLRRALALEPNRASALRALGDLEYVRRHFASSCALANASIGADSYDPMAYALRARVRMQLSEFRDAFSDAETASRLSSASWGDALQFLVSVNGKSVDDARLQARRVASMKLRPGAKLSVAEGVYTSLALEALGDRDRAIETLRRIEPAGIELTAALRDPGFDQMRGDTRFRRVAAAAARSAQVENESGGATVRRLIGTVPP